MDLTSITEHAHIISTLLASDKRKIYLESPKSSSKYRKIIEKDIPQKKKEYFLLTKNLVDYFDKYSTDEILNVIMKECLEKASIILKYYDLASLTFTYRNALTYKDVYELYDFIKYTLELALKAKYPGRIKEFDQESGPFKYHINYTALRSFKMISGKLPKSLAVNIAELLCISNFDENILKESGCFSVEEREMIEQNKVGILDFIAEYFSAVNALKSLNKLHSKVNYSLEKSDF